MTVSSEIALLMKEAVWRLPNGARVTVLLVGSGVQISAVVSREGTRDRNGGGGIAEIGERQ
jgi:hypothetical protein